MLLPDDTDDAAATLRFVRPAPDATSIYTIRVKHIGARRRAIRAKRQTVNRLREVLAEGWDVGPELAHEERRLAELEA